MPLPPRPGSAKLVAMAKARSRVRLRILLGADIMLGPGKADLLEQIAATGSIAAAGRALGMSYKRAWLLVEALNRSFREPLVAASKGGRGVGGAVLTPMGTAVLDLYRAMEERTANAVGTELATLEALLGRARDDEQGLPAAMDDG